MNAVHAIAVTGTATMTSREMADLTEKRHDNVKRTIDSLAESGVISRPQIEAGEKSANGVVETLYRIGKRDSYIIVAQMSPEMTARLVDRWQELEAIVAGPALPNFADPVAAARAWADAVEAKQVLQIELAAAAPAVAFVESYVVSTAGSKGFREVCKLIKANESDFREFLLDKKIMYRLAGAWTPHAAHLDAGRFEVKTGTSGEHVFNQAKFTGKGIDWVAGEWAKYQLIDQAA